MGKSEREELEPLFDQLKELIQPLEDCIEVLEMQLQGWHLI